MRVLITRPAEDGAAFAERLMERGVESLLAPVMTVRFLDDVELDLNGVQGVLATSANGVRALARLTGRRDLTVLAVGPVTAREAGDQGFATVVTAGGDVEQLANLVATTLKPEDGRLLHVAGSVVAGDLKGRLTDAGFAVERLVAYRAEPIARLPDNALEALRSGPLDAVVFFSARTASHFVKLCQEAGLRGRLAGLTAYCLSPAVADALAPAQFGRVLVAERPEGGGLLDLISSAATD